MPALLRWSLLQCRRDKPSQMLCWDLLHRWIIKCDEMPGWYLLIDCWCHVKQHMHTMPCWKLLQCRGIEQDAMPIRHTLIICWCDITCCVQVVLCGKLLLGWIID